MDANVRTDVCTRRDFLSSFGERDMTDVPHVGNIFSRASGASVPDPSRGVDSTGRAKWRYGKPRVSQLCEALTSQDGSRYSTKCLPRKSLLAWISWSLGILRSERFVNYVWDFLSFLVLLKVSCAPLSDAKPKGLRNEVINAPRFSRGKPSCFPRSFAQGWCKLLLIYLTGEFYWRLSGEVMVGDMRLSIMAWPIKLGAWFYPLHPLRSSAEFLYYRLKKFLKFCDSITCIQWATKIASSLKFLLFVVIGKKF